MRSSFDLENLKSLNHYLDFSIFGDRSFLSFLLVSFKNGKIIWASNCFGFYNFLVCHRNLCLIYFFQAFSSYFQNFLFFYQNLELGSGLLDFYSNSINYPLLFLLLYIFLILHRFKNHQKFLFEA